MSPDQSRLPLNVAARPQTREETTAAVLRRSARAVQHLFEERDTLQHRLHVRAGCGFDHDNAMGIMLSENEGSPTRVWPQLIVVGTHAS